MTRTAVALVVLAVAAGSAAQDPLAPPLPPPLGAGAPTVPTKPDSAKAKPRVLPRGAVLEEVNGVVREVSPRDNQLTIETGSGPVKLGYDRNTMVYTSSGLGTVRDLKPGVQARAGRNADMLAYWVQVRPASPAPSSTPGQGTGPAGASGPPTEGAQPLPSPPPGGSVGPGTVAPGTTPPATGGEGGGAGGTTGTTGSTSGTTGGTTPGTTGGGATGTTGGTSGAGGTAP